ncbi:MAG: YHS domain-containing protein [Desulfobacteraceae bacterium]|nr:MAG: YHS domain-containing protein [Desulfobacteraceae bacterium]
MAQEIDVQSIIDPVCGMEVDPVKAVKTCYNGIELYFCTDTCKNRFESAPQDYVVNQRKGFWRRYLERLNKATGGRPPSCHSI